MRPIENYEQEENEKRWKKTTWPQRPDSPARRFGKTDWPSGNFWEEHCFLVRFVVFSCPPAVCFLLCFRSCYNRRLSMWRNIFILRHKSSATALSNYMIRSKYTCCMFYVCLLMIYVGIILSNQQLRNKWHTVPVSLILQGVFLLVWKYGTGPIQ